MLGGEEKKNIYVEIVSLALNWEEKQFFKRCFILLLALHVLIMDGAQWNILGLEH